MNRYPLVSQCASWCVALVLVFGGAGCARDNLVSDEQARAKIQGLQHGDPGPAAVFVILNTEADVPGVKDFRNYKLPATVEEAKLVALELAEAVDGKASDVRVLERSPGNNAFSVVVDEMSEEIVMRLAKDPRVKVVEVGRPLDQ